MYSRQEVSDTGLAGLTPEPVSGAVQVPGNSDAMGPKTGVVSSEAGGEAGVVQQREV